MPQRTELLMETVASRGNRLVGNHAAFTHRVFRRDGHEGFRIGLGRVRATGVHEKGNEHR